MAEKSQKNVRLSKEAQNLLTQLCERNNLFEGQMIELLINRQAKKDKVVYDPAYDPKPKP